MIALIGASPRHKMESTRQIWRTATRVRPAQNLLQANTTNISSPSWICRQCLHHDTSASRPTTSNIFRRNAARPRQQRRWQSNAPADEPGFTSIVDNPPTLIRSNRKHNRWGLALLGAIPVTAFILGCWQVKRLEWKTDLIAKFEDRLVRDPLPLPPRIDPAAVAEFDYRRVYARGCYRHDQEMLIGPRLHDGKDGYLVVTPLERTEESSGKGTATILVNRGWISKEKAAKVTRPYGLPTGEVVVEGLLREPWKKNMFTPVNRPEEGKWYFPDVAQMAEHVGSQPVWIEETMVPDLITAYDREAKGIPIGRAAEVNLRNNHTE